MLRGRQAQPYFAGPYLPHQPLAVAKPPISGVPVPVVWFPRNLRTNIKLTVLGGGEG